MGLRFSFGGESVRGSVSYGACLDEALNNLWSEKRAREKREQTVTSEERK
jgi:hypothetical protein